MIRQVMFSNVRLFFFGFLPPSNGRETRGPCWHAPRPVEGRPTMPVPGALRRPVRCGPRAAHRSLHSISFAKRTRTGIYYDNARVTTTTWVTFHYFINKKTRIGVFVFSMTQGDNCRYAIPKPVVGEWTEVTIQVGGGQARIRSGEALDDVFIHAGKPGDKDLALIVDNVRLIGLD